MSDNEQDPYEVAESVGRLAVRELGAAGRQIHDAATQTQREERELRIKERARARYERKKAAGELPERQPARRRGAEL